MTGKTVKKNCKGCGKDIYPRAADVNRGWGKFCSKSCKAKKQAIKRNEIWTTEDISYGEIDHTPNYPTIDDFPE